MNKDERKWIHPLALAVLDETFRHECLAGRNYREIKPSSSLPNAHCLAKCGIAGLCVAESKWDDAGCPLLSDKAKAILEKPDDGMCDVCAGSGRAVSGRPCICDGTGRAFIAVINMRKELHALEEELEKARAVLEAVEKALEQCENCRGRLTFNSCNSGGVQIPGETQECPLASIRRVWKDEK